MALGFAKLVDPRLFVAFVGSHAFIPSGWSGPLAYSAAAGEVVLGAWAVIAGLVGRFRAPFVITILVSLGMVGFVVLSAPDAPACGCFGGLVQATRGRRLVVAGALVFQGAVALGTRQRRSVGVRSALWR